MYHFLVQLTVVDEQGEVVYEDGAQVTVLRESTVTDRGAFDIATARIREGIAA